MCFRQLSLTHVQAKAREGRQQLVLPDHSPSSERLPPVANCMGVHRHALQKKPAMLGHAVVTGNQCRWESGGIPLPEDCSDVRRVCLGLALFKDEFKFKRFLYFKRHVWKLHKQSISYVSLLDLRCSNSVFTSSPTLSVENMFSFRVDSQHTSAWYLSSLNWTCLKYLVNGSSQTP